MKKLFVIFFLIAGSVLFSQETGKMLQEGKWYAQGYPAKNKIILTRKAANDKQIATAEFLASGKVSYCDLVEETYFDANGNEKTTPAKFHCDTADGYEIRNNMVRIYWNNVKTWYFKIAANGENLELIPIKPEEYK